MAEPRRGEVYDAALPDPAGLTAVAVVTRDALVPYLGSVAVVPVRSHARGLPTDVPVGADAGLPDGSVLAADSVATIPKSLLRRRRGALGLADQEALAAAVRLALDL
jgi:mRNA-degrading endonuclease toxin of MazEF toxin-antitoxin module